ncbi:MAG: tryptophan synthase subunit beta [Spirochaetaceae bacterium]|nr:tryptophan synthase subunit beta [Spirochaetaceae bacterium]
MEVYNDYFGQFGGRYVAENLRGPLDQLEIHFRNAMSDSDFLKEISDFGKEYIGRPTPLLFAENASRAMGGGDIYIKLEGLANTGAHKINNAAGQAILAKKMGKTRIIAETGAGQHGVATAAVCARLGLKCRIYMGSEDIKRQRPNVFLMEMFGAEVFPVDSGSRTLKDAVNEALRDWASTSDETHYLIGSALGPSPYPDMVREFQSVIGKEVLMEGEKRSLNVKAMVACVGGGSNAIGFFEPFIENETPRLIGAEAGGLGPEEGKHAARMTGKGKTGIIQGYKSKFLYDKDGQIVKTHSISAGLDYPGIGPQLAYLGTTGRVEFTEVNDEEALEALRFFALNEGIIFALESAHAGAAGLKIASEYSPGEAVIINMSGRGDKDIFITAKALQKDKWFEFLNEETANG